jgi:myxalamid-type polyketide synthase MxaE and MxaD
MGTLGLESLTALEFRKRLEVSLGLRLSATIVWNYPTVSALAEHLAARMDIPPADEPAAGARPVAAETSSVASELLKNIQVLSEDEALYALMGEAKDPR